MKLVSSAVAAAAAFTLAATVANATPAVTLTSPGLYYNGAPYTLGFSFTVASAQTITALGIFDDNGDGLNGAANVGLWDSSGNLLASAVVPAGTAGALDGLFRYASISPFGLTPGATYYVGGYEPDDNASSLNTFQGGSGFYNPAVTVIEDQYSDFDYAFSFPDTSEGAAGGAWLGANFELGSAAVPEPAPWAVMLLGVGVVGGVLRRRTRPVLA
jgi:hypothetical protein